MPRIRYQCRVWRLSAAFLALWLAGCGSLACQTNTPIDGSPAPDPTLGVVASYTPVPPTPQAQPTLTSISVPTTTAPPAATALPPAEALGEDCSQVERLDPDSVDGQRVVIEFERAQTKLVPFDPLVFEAVYDISRQNGYLLIVGQRYEMNWIWAGLDSGKEVTPLGAFVPMKGVTYSRYVIHDFFTDVLPEAPPALFGCYPPAVLPLIESDDPALIVDPEADCTQVERPDLMEIEIQHFVPQMANLSGGSSDKLLPPSTAWRVDDWTFISATFANPAFEGGEVNGAFLVRPPNYMLFSAGGGIYSRRLLMREIYQAYPEVPRLLLSCAMPVIATNLRPLIEHGYYAFANKAVWERTPMP